MAIQSMTNTRTEDVEATVAQILGAGAGRDARSSAARCPPWRPPRLWRRSRSGSISRWWRTSILITGWLSRPSGTARTRSGSTRAISAARTGCRPWWTTAKGRRHVPIRVGVNSGSLEKPLVEKYGGVTAEGPGPESAMEKVHMIEEMGYDHLVVSIKSSDVLMCVEAHELVAQECPYPLHVGITESGTLLAGQHQVLHRPGPDPPPGHRRHHPGVPDRRSQRKRSSRPG